MPRQKPRSGKCGKAVWVRRAFGCPARRQASYAWRMTQDTPSIVGLQLPIDWTTFGWPEHPEIGGVGLATGDPKWAWTPAGPSFEIHTMQPPHAMAVEDFWVDHVVMLVPSLENALATLGRIDLTPRLRMPVGGRPAAFFRVGPVLEVIESPVRQASIYGVAVTTSIPLETLRLTWASLGLSVGDIKPAIQPRRRIMTVRGLDAGFAVMSPDRDV